MSEDLTPLQKTNIDHVVKKLYQSEKIVNHDIDMTKWDIKKLYKDTLWLKMIDDPDANTIMSKGGIALPVNTAKGLYRIGQVLMCGPGVVDAKEGDYVRFNTGLGQPYEKIVDGYKTALVREDAIMMVVEFKGDDVEQDIIDNILLK